MNRILVTGGDGALGSQIVGELARRGQAVRGMGRSAAPKATPAETGGVEWAQADMASGAGIVDALRGVNVIVNCASSPAHDTYETDVAGTRRLLAQAKDMDVRYVVHISIIGIDRIIYPYYQYKLAAEQYVVESGIPFLIARSAQFHSFVDYALSPLRQVTGEAAAIQVDAQFQPISTRDVAEHLAPYIVAGKTVGRLDDFGGPEVLRLGDMAAAWLDVQGMRLKIRPAIEWSSDLPFLSKFGDGFVQGYNTAPQNRIGRQTWNEYLQETYA